MILAITRDNEKLIYEVCKENGFENPGWFINEESVEKEEYEAKLGDVFDFDNAENIYSLIVSRDEIVDYITNY